MTFASARPQRAIAMAVGLAMSLSCTSNAERHEQLDSDRASVVDFLLRSDSLFNSGDPNGYADLWASDGVALLPGEDAIDGRAAVRRHFEGTWVNGNPWRRRSAIAALVFPGERAIARVAVELSREGTEEGSRSGHGVLVLVRDANEVWRIGTAIWNWGDP